MEYEDGLRAGTLLQGGKYRIEKVLGQGGFGITYRAKMKLKVGGSIGSMIVESDVAIKEFFIQSECERVENSNAVTIPSKKKAGFINDYRKKFTKEATNLSKLNHENIVKVIDIFEENETQYFVMEYISGKSLSDIVNKQGAMNESEAVKVIEQLASAVDYIHSHNVMHLDIKPANILMDESGCLKLVDFGLSKHYDAKGGQTSTGIAQGVSEGFSPMEQYEYGGVSEFSPQTDIYAVGATLAYLLTGKVPPGALKKEKLTLPETISEQLRNAINAAMQLEAVNRPASIREFLWMIGNEVKFRIPVAVKKMNSKETRKLGNTQLIPPREKSSKESQTTSYLSSTIKISERGLRFPKWWWILLISFILGLVVLSLVSYIYERKEAEMSAMIEEATSGYINGHEWVDLGLPSGLKWATCNVGASSPSEYGDYFAWGETTTKSSYTSDNCKTWEKNIGNIGGNISYDAARANWGSSWRLPTQSEFEELLNNCTWTWTTQGGHNGYKVKSKKNGNSIFLPAAGYRDGSSLYFAGVWGVYWGSTPNSSNTQYAFSLLFTSGGRSMLWHYRYYGQGVRAVSE